MIYSATVEQCVLYVKSMMKYMYVTSFGHFGAVIHENQAEFSQKIPNSNKHPCFYGV